ncbi:hypothetical protein JCM10914A_54230 [Paenibacillus sp. JCM 10914]|uniref:YlzJ-like family protein n=1 Tax=Paenibacillus sp. JCM 10914 TaxID=1236974 RepID=UPI0005639181|nr:YlzJ-like family protein [Paenibacillus sp. JCM 10914]
MIWYSVMPLDMTSTEPKPDSSTEIRVEGVLMEVEPLSKTHAKIVRLLDCGLDDYLNPRFAPGGIICYIPTLEEEDNV